VVHTVCKAIPTWRPAVIIPVDVECYAGHRGEETPRAFRLGERRIEVARVLDCWLAPDHRYFKVACGSGDTYIIRYDVDDDRWELIMFRAEAVVPGPSSPDRTPIA